MRYVCSAAAAVIAFIISAPSIALGQAGPQFSITNYQFVSELRVTRTTWYVTYRADVVNHGGSAATVTAAVTSLAPTVQVVAGQGTLHFPTVPPNGQATSLDAFTLLVDRSVPFDFSFLQWSFLSPIANAGPNQTVTVGQTVALNGSGSSNPSGVGTLTYSWAFQSRPASSAAVLSGATGVMASFVVDVGGAYVVTLTVSNGVATDSATVTINTVNSPPVAKPGPNQTVSIGSGVTLNGSGSSDVDGDPLTYLWALVTQPAGSSAVLSNVRSPIATFVADQAGTYVAQLVVNDGAVNSAPATVIITTSNTPPVANAGPNQNVNLNSLVQLNGSGSTDVDGNPLTFRWGFNSIPAGSAASLSAPTAVNPTFTADSPGTYVAQLIVNDGIVDSTPSTVTVTTNAIQAPVANAGPNQTVVHGAVATLSGSGTDPQGLPLTLTWSLTTRPAGSTAALSDTSSPNPTFIADMPGIYVAQLVVGNGHLNSLPATVTITTTNTPPVAVAGANQNVAAGATVFLDGSGSSDADHDPLTYSWSLITSPSSSTTVLQGAGTRTPSFFADMPGTYVAQLIVNDGFTNSIPATVTITAGGMRITLSPNPLNLGNAPQILTITLSAPAGAGGVPISLSGFDPSVISLPSTVIAPENSSGANVTVTPVSPGSTNILASAPGYQPGTTAVTVTTPTITVTLSSTAVGLTHTINGAITLGVPAPAGDAQIALSSSPAGGVTFDPPIVTISAGSTIGTFKVVGGTYGPATITAVAAGYIDGTASILVVHLGGIALPTDLTVAPGQSTALNVRLSTPAPVDGTTVSLASSDTGILGVSPSVFIPPGATSPATPAQVQGIAYGFATVTASADGYLGDSQTVQVAAVLSFSPQVVTVGAAGEQSINVLLSAPAPAGGLSVTLVSSNPAVATAPPSVVISANATSSPGVLVSGIAAGSATITASTTTPGIGSGSLQVTVVPVPTITTAALPNGVAGAPYNGALAAIGGTPPYAWTATGLPAGLAIDPATGAITGTPSATGGATVNVTVTDATSPTHLSATKQFSVTIVPGLTITTAALPNGVVGSAYSGPVAALGGTTPYAWTATGLPAGLSIDPSSGSIVGTPSAAGTATVNVSVTDATSPTPFSTTKQFTVTIAPTLSITTASLPNGMVGLAYSGSASASGGTPPYAWTATGLPAGLAIDPATGAITGTPSAAGGATVNVTVTDATSPTPLSVSKQFPVTIAPALSITTASMPDGVAGSAYTAPMAATGGTPPYAWTATGLPAGLAIDPATGAITGTPSAAGAATVNVTVTDAASPTHFSVSKQFPVTIAPALSITTASMPNGVVGSAYTAPMAATGGTPPYAWTATGLPAGLAIDPATGAITGTPSAAGGATVNVTVTDTTSPTHLSVSKQFSVTIAAALSITTSSLPNGMVGLAYSGPVSASGGTPPYAWTATGLPAGLAIDPATGAITGTPSAAGGATVNVTVTDTTSPTHLSVSKQFPVTIAPTLSITTASMPNGVVGTAYTAPMAATGGTPPYAWTATGLPAGLAIDPATGAITGTPGAAGPATVNVTVTDATSPTHLSVTKQFSVTIGNGLTITTASLPNGVVGSVYSGPVSASGGTTPYTWTATGLPAGLAIDPATGAITGTPGAAGAATVNVTVTDSSSPTHLSVSTQFTVTIAPTLSIITASLPNGVVGSVYTGPVAAAGGTPPYAWTATGLPAGLAVDPATGAITGTPTSAGAATVNVTVTDTTSPTHLSVSKQFPVTIAPTLAITTTSLPNGIATSPYNFTVAASGGTPPYTWSATGLPSGLSIDPASGAVTGTTTATGTSTVSITVTDVTSPAHLSVTQQFSLIIMPALAITTQSPLPNGVATSPYSFTVVASGGTPPYAWTATSLPAELSIDPATGAITGTPTAAATATVNVTVTDTTSPTHQSASKNLTLTIGPALALTTASMPNGVVGSAYTAPMAATGGTTPYAWTATGLPAGLAIDPATGAITGTPSAAGAATVNVAVTDATSPTHQSVTKPFSFTIAPPPTITTLSLPNGTQAVAYNSGPLAASGGTPPYTWTASGLPAGLAMDPATGAVTGTPSAPGTSTVNVLATDSTTPTHQTANKQYSVTIAPGVLTITTSSPLPGGSIGAAYNTTVLASGGTAPFHWSATGLPAGLTINASTGQITGTPTAGGTFSANVSVSDSGSPVQNAGPKAFSITIQNLTITTTVLPTGTVGVFYSVQLTAVGGVAPLTWSMSVVPRNWTFDPATGILSGTSTQPLSNPFTFAVTDSSSPQQMATRDLTLTILPIPLSFIPPALPAAVINQPYQAPALVATGGNLPYTWSANPLSLPLGLTLDPVSGVISGTPTVVGTTSFNVTITDGGSPTPQTVTKPVTVAVTFPGGSGVITVSNVTVGVNLQVPITINFTPPLPIGSTVTITSGDPGSVLLGSGADSGAMAIQALLSAGTASVTTFVKALGPSVPVTVTASIPGYIDGTGTVTLANSGFVVSGTNGIGGAVSTFQGVSSTLTVYAARLDGSGLFVESEPLRGGYAVNVPISSTVTNVGDVAQSTVAFSGGMDNATLQFVACSSIPSAACPSPTTGVTNVIIGSMPFPFSQPAAGGLLVVTVNSSGLIPFSATIGKNLQTNVSVSRNGSTLNSAVVTVQSLDATKLMFSATPTGTPSASIDVTIPPGQSSSRDFYAHAFASTGTVAYTLSSTSYGGISSNVTLTPSELVILSPFGFGRNFTMPTGSVDATIAVYTARLDGSLNPYQAVATGVSIPVAVAADNPAVGNITASPISIAAGQSSATTTFHAVATGSADITASSAGYGSSSVGVTVTSQNLICTGGLTIGQHLQDVGQAIVPGGAPAAGLHVTLQSNSPSLVLSTSATAAGSGPIAFDLTSGTIVTPNFYIQSQGTSGNPTYTVSAPGYGSATCGVALAPSGVVIVNFGSPIISLGGGPQPLTVLAAQLDASGNPATPQSLAGGPSLAVSLTNTNRDAGTVPATVTIAPGTDRINALFTPAAAGSTTVSVTQPGGWTLPTSLTSTGITVQ